jgi:septal ring factor EnvC (AmiA/AmiB activator)
MASPSSKKVPDECSGYVSEFNHELVRRMDALEANQRRMEDKNDAKLERIEELVTAMRDEQKAAAAAREKADEECQKADEKIKEEIGKLKTTVAGHSQILKIGGTIVTAIWGVTWTVIGWIWTMR